jgi:ribokinase
LKNIVVLGSINTDFVIRTARHPKPGETVLGGNYETHFGGKGMNQAIAAALLGANVSLIGRVGNDRYGSNALENLNRMGVDAKHVVIDPSTPSGVAFIVIDDRGMNTIVVSPGANSQVNIQDLDSAKALFTSETILVAQLEIYLPTVIDGIRLARANGGRIILNAAPALELDPAILSEVDTLILNETELQNLTHCTNIQEGIRILKNLRVKQIVLTLGENGCTLISENQEFNLPPHPVKVVDTTGAGDAFVGAFSAAVAEDKDFYTAGVWGNAAGAIAVTTSGAELSSLTRNQIFQLIDQSNLSN